MKLQRNLHCKKLEGNITMCALITFTEVPLKTWANPGGKGTRTRRRKLSASHTQTTSENPVGEEEK
jgi:hypothetical protein